MPRLAAFSALVFSTKSRRGRGGALASHRLALPGSEDGNSEAGLLGKAKDDRTWQQLEPRHVHQTSRLATFNALVSMKSRRGSTTSPIKVAKI